jgi:type I restriction enzyme S subunit
MWFAREACFYAVDGVRGSLEWEDCENMLLPVPHIDIQREIVKEYNTVQNRINLNEQLIQKLEETAQAIYREWFVEFEFPFDFAQGKPDENGKPYKSSGGEMIWNEEMEKEIPVGWEVKPFTKIVEFGGGGTSSTKYPEYWNGSIPFYTPGDLTQHYYSITSEKMITTLGLSKCSSKLYPVNTTFVTARGATVGGVGLAGIPMAMNQSCYAVNGNDLNDFYIHQLTLQVMSQLKNETVGATFEALVTKDFDSYLLVHPIADLDKIFSSKVNNLYQLMLLKSKENQKCPA